MMNEKNDKLVEYISITNQINIENNLFDLLIFTMIVALIFSIVILSKFDNEGFSRNFTIRSPSIRIIGNTNSSIAYKNK